VLYCTRRRRYCTRYDLIQKEFNEIAKCAILSVRNAKIDEINKRVIELDTFEERIYTSTKSTENCS